MIDYENWLKGMDDCNAGRPPAMPEDRAYMAGYGEEYEREQIANHQSDQQRALQ